MKDPFKRFPLCILIGLIHCYKAWSSLTILHTLTVSKPPAVHWTVEYQTILLGIWFIRGFPGFKLYWWHTIVACCCLELSSFDFNVLYINGHNIFSLTWFCEHFWIKSSRFSITNSWRPYYGASTHLLQIPIYIDVEIGAQELRFPAAVLTRPRPIPHSEQIDSLTLGCSTHSTLLFLQPQIFFNF